MTVRDSAPSDHSAIRALLLAAFEGAAEADLVETLRAADAVAVGS